jgi:hypothetical protein
MLQSLRLALVTIAIFSTNVSAQEKAFARIAARYEQVTEFLDKKQAPQRIERLFFRDPNHVEFRSGDIGEVWERDGNGSLTLYKIAFGERAAIEYLPGDLRAMDNLPNWERLQSFIDPTTFAKLEPEAKTSVLARAANRYRTKTDRADTEIVWLTEEKLPGLIRSEYPEKIVTLRLLELSTQDDSAFKPTSIQALQNFKLIEFSDIGDKETDPFVQRLSQIFGHGQGGH